MKFINTLLEKKIVTGLCIIVAIVCRITSLIYLEIFGYDKIWPFLQSKSFVNGKGLGVPEYFVSQLDYPVYNYIPKWPPGYPILISPFLKFFNYDIYWSTGIIDILSCIALIFIVRKIATQLSFPLAAVNILTLIAGCFEYPFISRSFPTDTISLVFFLLAISFLYKNITTIHFSVVLQILCGFLLFLPCTFRYAYFPVVLSIPLVIILFGWFLNDKLLIRKGFTVIGVLSIFLIIFLMLLYKFTGQISYVNTTEKGYFWGNLTHWYPVIPWSFIDYSFFITQAIKNTPLKSTIILFLIQVANVIALLLFSFCIYSFFRKKNFRTLPNYKWGIVFGIVASIMICLSLGYLSLTNKAQNSATPNWNYIAEGRYFAILILFIQFFFIASIFLSNSWKKNIWQKAILIICSFVMFLEISHSIYFHTKVMLNFKQYQYTYSDHVNGYFRSVLTSMENEYKGHDILVGSDDLFFQCMASYYGKKGIFDVDKLNYILPKVKTKSILIMVIVDGNKDQFKKFLSNNNIRKISSADHANFYLLELYPE